jgi:multimeric flavodoxin WrbA
VGICGCLRKKSYTRLALKLALRGAEEAGAESHLIDRHDYQLVFCDGGDSGDDPPMMDVMRLKAVRRQVAKFASLHNSDQAREFLQFCEASVENPGGIDR